MANPKNTNYFLPMAVIAAAGIIFWYTQRKPELDNMHGLDEDHSTVTVASSGPEESLGSRLAREDNQNAPEVMPSTTEEVPQESAAELHAKEQALLKENFQREIHLKMNFPASLNFKTIDMEGEVAAIYGREPQGDKKMAVLATRGKIGVEEAVKYLNEEKGSIPLIREKGFRVAGATQNISTKMNPSFGSITVIPGKGSNNGLALYAVLATRADNKGSYLFMMEARPSYFDSNDDGFEAMLRSVEVQP